MSAKLAVSVVVGPVARSVAPIVDKEEQTAAGICCGAASTGFCCVYSSLMEAVVLHVKNNLTPEMPRNVFDTKEALGRRERGNGRCQQGDRARVNLAGDHAIGIGGTPTEVAHRAVGLQPNSCSRKSHLLRGKRYNE